MKLPVKPLCEQKRIRRDGTAFICIQYCYDAEHKTFLNTEISIPPAHWDRKKLSIKDSLPRQYGEPSKLNDDIDRQIRLVENLIKLATRQDVAEAGAYVKEKYKPDLKLVDMALKLDRAANSLL
jgi:hypothetical protein